MKCVIITKSIAQGKSRQTLKTNNTLSFLVYETHLSHKQYLFLSVDYEYGPKYYVIDFYNCCLYQLL